MSVSSVLVPENAVEDLAAVAPPDVRTVGYTYQSLSVLGRIRRRVGLSPGAGSLEEKLGLPPSAELADVGALWLSERISLTPLEWQSLLERLPSLKWVFSQRTSYHHLDLEIFRRRGVAVSNSGNLVSRWVAEFALASIVAERKRLPEHVRRDGPGARPIFGQGFGGTRVVVLGTGRIGAELASMCSHLGMTVDGLSRTPGRFPNPPTPYARIFDLRTELSDTLSEADFVVVALPSGKETRGILGQREIRQLPKTASIVSVAHPEVIDQEELFSALRERRIASAYLDRTQPFRRFGAPRVPNLVLTHNSTAHVAEKSAAALEKFLRGIEALRASGDPEDRVV